jgi:type II secretory pathway pseudopilin PulG
MSLIEVLIAVLLMVTVALSLLPLFSRSIRQNREGGTFTELNNMARSTLEEFTALDFNSPRLTLPGGSTELVVHEYWNGAQRRWVAMADANSAPAGALWQRTVRVEQYASGGLATGQWLGPPLDGGTNIAWVQLKLVRVVVRPLWRSTEVGRRDPIVLEVIKGF